MVSHLYFSLYLFVFRLKPLFAYGALWAPLLLGPAPGQKASSSQLLGAKQRSDRSLETIFD